MAVPGFLAPIGGALVAGGILYSFSDTLTQRTNTMTAKLAHSRQILQDIDHPDPTGRLTPAFRAPIKPTMGEELKARWNEQLSSFYHTVSTADWGSVASNTYSALSKSVSSISDSAQSAVESISNSTSSSGFGSGSGEGKLPASLTEPQPGNLRDTPSNIKSSFRSLDPRLAQPNTYYLGQGTSLK